MARWRHGASEAPPVPPPPFSVTREPKTASAAPEEVAIPAPIFSVTGGAPPPSKDRVDLPDAHDPVAGSGRWLYEAKLGEGGLAVVFQAWDTKGGLGQVAVKVLKKHSKAHARHAFAMHRESQWSIQKLHNSSDPQYCASHAALFARYLEDHTGFAELGPSDFEERRKEYESPRFDWSKNRISLPGKPYVVMELVRGETLQVAMDREYRPARAHEQPSLSQTEKNDVILQCVTALEYLERFNLIHRDFRGCNMQLIARRKDDSACKLKILDLGVMISAEAGNERNANMAVQAFRRRGDTEEKRKRYDWLPWEVRDACDDVKGPVHNFDPPGHAFDTFSLGVLILHLLVGKTEARQILDSLKDHPERILDATSIGVPRDVLRGILAEAAARPTPSQVAQGMVSVAARYAAPPAAKAAKEPAKTAAATQVVSSRSHTRAHETISHTTTKVEGGSSDDEDEDEVVAITAAVPEPAAAKEAEGSPSIPTSKAPEDSESSDNEVKEKEEEIVKEVSPEPLQQEKDASRSRAKGAADDLQSTEPSRKEAKGVVDDEPAPIRGRKAKKTRAKSSPNRSKAKKKAETAHKSGKKRKSKTKVKGKKERSRSRSRSPSSEQKKSKKRKKLQAAKAKPPATRPTRSNERSQSRAKAEEAEVSARSRSPAKAGAAEVAVSRSPVKTVSTERASSPPANDAKADVRSQSRSPAKTTEAKDLARSRSRSREDSKARKQRQRREKARALLANADEKSAAALHAPEAVEVAKPSPKEEVASEAPVAQEQSPPENASVLQLLRRQQAVEKEQEEAEHKRQLQREQKERAAREKAEKERQAQQEQLQAQQAQQAELQQAWVQQAQLQQQQILAMQAEGFYQQLAPQQVPHGHYAPLMYGMQPNMMVQQPQALPGLAAPPPAPTQRCGSNLPKVVPGGVQKAAPPKPLPPGIGPQAKPPPPPPPGPPGAVGGHNGQSGKDIRSVMAAAAAQLMKQQRAGGLG